MLKRTLFFSSPTRLALRDKQLVFNLKEAPQEKRTVPIEDIGYVILEDQTIEITLPLLNALSENNVAIIFCNNKQFPASIFLSLDSHSTQAETFRAQAAASEPLKKNLWKQTVEAKIRNQAALLRKLGMDGDRLKPHL